MAQHLNNPADDPDRGNTYAEFKRLKEQMNKLLAVYPKFAVQTCDELEGASRIPGASGKDDQLGEDSDQSMVCLHQAVIIVISTCLHNSQKFLQLAPFLQLTTQDLHGTRF